MCVVEKRVNENKKQLKINVYMASGGEDKGCGCAIMLALFIIAGIRYELEHAFEGGVWAWVIIGVLVAIAIILILGGLVGGIIRSIIDMFK